MARRHVFVSAFLAVTITVMPLAALYLFGLAVPSVFQSKFDSPAPSLHQGDIWTQTFFFPDMPVTGITLRPGTYGGGGFGVVTAWIGPESDFEAGDSRLSGREFIIDIERTDDSKPQTYRFSSVRYEKGTPGVLVLVGTDIPPKNVFTLWQHSENKYPDSYFSINGNRQRGDIFFKILSPVRGLDIFRMIKSRWQSGFRIESAWPILSIFLWIAALSTGLYLLLSCRDQGVS